IAATAVVVLSIAGAAAWWRLRPHAAEAPPVAQRSQPPPSVSRAPDAPPIAMPQTISEKKSAPPRRVGRDAPETKTAATGGGPARAADPARNRAAASALAQALVDRKFADVQPIEKQWRAVGDSLGDVRWHSAPYAHGDSYFVWFEFPRGTADLRVDF